MYLVTSTAGVLHDLSHLRNTLPTSHTDRLTGNGSGSYGTSLLTTANPSNPTSGADASFCFFCVYSTVLLLIVVAVLLGILDARRTFIARHRTIYIIQRFFSLPSLRAPPCLG
jgi:hypothetical protein